jgi:phosphoglycolate phosphatase
VRPLKLVVFDVDGTLVDSQHLIVAAQAEAFAACGLDAPTRERSLSVVGLSLPNAFRALVGPDGPVEALADAYKRAFQRLRADPTTLEPLFPGAAETVDRLSARGVLLGIATGKSRRGVQHLLDRLGWQDRFASVRTADDAPSKPDPTMLRQALREAGARPEETILIGDTSFDMAMAAAIGASGIGAAWGYHPVEELRAAGAERIVLSFAEFDALVDERLGAAGSARRVAG